VRLRSSLALDVSEPKYFFGDRQNPVGTVHTEGNFNFPAQGSAGMGFASLHQVPADPQTHRDHLPTFFSLQQCPSRFLGFASVSVPKRSSEELP